MSEQRGWSDAGHQPRRHRDQWVWGVVLIGVGLAFLFDRLDMFDAAGVWVYWPVITAVIGLARLLRAQSAKDVLGALWLLVVSAWWTVSYNALWGLGFDNSWPIFLIAGGAGMVLRPLLERHFSAKREDGHA